jgi:hypothetical protein
MRGRLPKWIQPNVSIWQIWEDCYHREIQIVNISKDIVTIRNIESNRISKVSIFNFTKFSSRFKYYGLMNPTWANKHNITQDKVNQSNHLHHAKELASMQEFKSIPPKIIKKPIPITPIVCIHKKTKQILKFTSALEAQKHGFDPSHISKVLLEKIKSHRGYHIYRADDPFLQSYM